MIDTTICPECGGLAEVQDRDVLDSTGGPVEHVRIACVNRHWFLLPLESCTQPAAGRRPRRAHAPGSRATSAHSTVLVASSAQNLR